MTTEMTVAKIGRSMKKRESTDRFSPACGLAARGRRSLRRQSDADASCVGHEPLTRKRALAAYRLMHNMDASDIKLPTNAPMTNPQPRYTIPSCASMNPPANPTSPPSTHAIVQRVAWRANIGVSPIAWMT